MNVSIRQYIKIGFTWLAFMFMCVLVIRQLTPRQISILWCTLVTICLSMNVIEYMSGHGDKKAAIRTQQYNGDRRRLINFTLHVSETLILAQIMFLVLGASGLLPIEFRLKHLIEVRTVNIMAIFVAESGLLLVAAMNYNIRRSLRNQ